MIFVVARVDDRRRLVVSGERWWDVRHVALLHFRCEVAELEFRAVDVGEADVETRWVGQDSNTDRRRMEYRKAGGQWLPIEQYSA